MTSSFLDQTPMIPRATFRWSFSQWETYDQCPAKWRYGSVLKLPRKPPGPAASRGLDIHDSVEAYIKGGVSGSLHPAVNPKYISVLDEFKHHENGDRWTEKKLGVDAEWNICPPQSPYAFCVAVLDAVRYDNSGILHIGEWKSGKPKDSHADQRKLYAVFGMKAWRAVEVRATTYYLEDTHPPQRITVKSEAGWQTLKNLWEGRIRTMQRDEMCAPRPSFGCRFCDYAKDKGGPCQFGG